MDKMKMLKRWELAIGILTMAAFVILAAGSRQLPVYATLTALAVFLGGIITEIVLDSRKRELAARIQAAMPVITDMATIVSRRVRHSYRMSARGGSVSSTNAWCLTFETSKNGAVELSVPWDVWQHNPDGTRGQLRYKGGQFIRFRKM